MIKEIVRYLKICYNVANPIYKEYGFVLLREDKES